MTNFVNCRGNATSKIGSKRARKFKLCRFYLDAVFFTGFGTQKEYRNAGNETGNKSVETTGLIQILGVAIDQARGAEHSATACNDIGS